MLRFEETEKAGAYEVHIKSDPPRELKFAVQSNPEESNLTDLAPDQLDSLAALTQVVHWAPGMNLSEQIALRHGGQGTELWTILTMLVLAAACVELVLGGIFSAAK